MASTGGNAAAADADDNTTPTTSISNRGFDLVGFTMALDNLTLLVEDESRHGDLASMHDLLKRVQKLYKILQEKAEVAGPDVMIALGKVLAFFLNLDRVKDEPLCCEACNFVPTLARGWTYRGAEFAMIVTPDLLACLEKGGGPVSSSAYQSMCAIVSHCYEAEGRLLALILGAMDGNIRRQLYQLIKIAIEKWPPSSVQAHMPAFRERLVLDIVSTSKAHRDWSTQSFLVLTRKYPEQAVQVFHKLTKDVQTRLVRDHPTLQASMPRHTRRSSSSSSSMTSPSSSRVTMGSSPSTLSASKRQPGSAATAAAAAAAGTVGGEGGGAPRVAKASSSASQQELHQKLLKYKLENNPRFKDAALQAALSRPVAWELSSDDGSTTSSIRSDGTGSNSGSRHTNSASRRAEQMLRHKLNVMSPTDFHLIAEAQANNSLLMGGLDSPSSPMMLFQQDLNQSMANFDAERGDEVTPAIAQAAAAAAAAAVGAGSLDESEEMAGQYLDRSTRGAAQFNQDEDHYEGDDENSSSVQGSINNSSNSNVTTRWGSSFSSSHGKRVSFSDKVIVTLPPATPLFPPTPVPDRLQQDDGNSLDGSMRPSDDQGWDKDGEEEEEEEEEECFDHDSGMDEHDLSVSKKNLMSDIAEEEEEEEEDEGSVDDEEGEVKAKAKVGVTVAGNTGVKQQQAERAKQPDFASKPRFLLLLSIAILFMMGVASVLRKQQANSITPPLQEQKPTVAQVSFVPRGEKVSIPPKQKSPPPVAATPEKKAPTVQTRATPARSPKQKHWPFRKQQKWVEPDEPVVPAAKSRSQPEASSSSSRGDVQPTPQKNVWHHVRDALHRLLNFRMLGVLLGYTLLYSFLV